MRSLFSTRMPSHLATVSACALNSFWYFERSDAQRVMISSMVRFFRRASCEVGPAVELLSPATGLGLPLAASVAEAALAAAGAAAAVVLAPAVAAAALAAGAVVVAKLTVGFVGAATDFPPSAPGVVLGKRLPP